jgi:hypothetical protein
VPIEEPLAELAEQVALGSALVPVPLPVGPILIDRTEAIARRFDSGHRVRSCDTGRCIEGGRRRTAPASANGHSLPDYAYASLYIPRPPVDRSVYLMPYYECPKCGGGYVIDVPPSARPLCDRDQARLKRTSDASYEKNARQD